jgi:hypothetical protein
MLKIDKKMMKQKKNMNEKQDKNEYEMNQDLKHIKGINPNTLDKSISLAGMKQGTGNQRNHLSRTQNWRWSNRPDSEPTNSKEITHVRSSKPSVGTPGPIAAEKGGQPPPNRISCRARTRA